MKRMNWNIVSTLINFINTMLNKQRQSLYICKDHTLCEAKNTQKNTMVFRYTYLPNNFKKIQRNSPG